VGAPLRLAVVGLVHDHVWGLLEQFRATGEVVPVAAVDPNRPLTERAQREFGFDQALPAIDGLWELRPDAVLCCTSNAASAAVVEACAEHGVPVMVEKPLSANLAQARRIAAASRRSGVPVMCNWPTAWDPKIRHAVRLAREGALGHVYTVRYRAAHAGPREIGCSPYFWSWLYDSEQNGAGALMDYCCYGAALAAWLLGLPETVTGVAGRLVKTDIPVDDNAILLLRYPAAFGIAEASWTQAGRRPYGFQVLGHQAGLVVEQGHLLRVDAAHPEGEPVEVPPLPPEERHGPAYFVHCLRTGKQPQGLVGLDVAYMAQQILEAGLLASRTGLAVRPASL
jgi:predicted dehydrogenase